jgi:hypothetical protein
VDLKVVGETLVKLDMPKPMIGRFLNMVGCYIEPPEYSQLKDVDSETLGKYEYINLFRKDFR